MVLIAGFVITAALILFNQQRRVLAANKNYEVATKPKRRSSLEWQITHIRLDQEKRNNGQTP